MRYVLIGEDDYSIRQALEEIKKGVGDPEMLMTNTTVLDGHQVTPEQFQAACETVPFLAEKRLVIVEGLLGRFEPRGKAGKKKSDGKEDDFKCFLAAIGRVPESTELVLVDGKVGSRNLLLQYLPAVASVRSFPFLKEPGLKQWIEKRVKGAGGSIAPQAVNMLVRFVGNSLWVLAGEVDKVVLYALGRRIEEDDVRAVVSYAQEGSVFNMVDAILEFRAGAAQNTLQQLLIHGAAPAYLLMMLARQVHLIFRVKYLRDRRVSRNDIQSRLGLSSDFVLRKAWAQADKYSLARLNEVYHKLLEADLAVKTGKYEGELVLNVLIAELAQSSTANA